jgi:hypothetical protein
MGETGRPGRAHGRHADVYVGTYPDTPAAYGKGAPAVVFVFMVDRQLGPLESLSQPFLLFLF